jgi:hypothetical protein
MANNGENHEFQDPPDIVINKLQQQIQSLKKRLSKAKVEYNLQKIEINKNKEELNYFKFRAKEISKELNLYRQSKRINLTNRFLRKFNLWNSVSKSFQQLKDDTLIFNRRLAGFNLQYSSNLETLPYLSYYLYLARSNLSGILLAPILDFPLSKGSLCIQILFENEQIIAESCLPVIDLNEKIPAQFCFSSIPNSDRKPFELKIFGRDIDGTLRILELTKYSLLGFGFKRTKPFCGFIFAE